MKETPQTKEAKTGNQKAILLTAIKAIVALTILVIVLTGLYLLSQRNYLFFHTTVEVFSIVISFAIFAIGWNSRKIMNNNYLLFVSIAFLFVGGLALLHSLTYKGLNVFPGIDANWATQLWIAMRYLLSFSMLFALIFIHKKLRPELVLAVFSIVFGLIIGSIFYWQIFPVAFVEGQGLTAFKVVSEYIVSAILVVVIILLYRDRKEFSGNVTKYTIGSMVAIITSEMSFTLYVDVYGFFNLFGHMLNVIAFYLIYKAIVETGLSRPHELLFFSMKTNEEILKQSEERYRGALDNMIEGCQIIGRDWRYIYINDAAERHNRRPKDELLDKRYMDMWPGIESTKFFGVIKDCMENRVPQSMENYFVYPDGTSGWFDLRVDPIPEGIFILSMDITERKITEDALKTLNDELEDRVRQRTAQVSTERQRLYNVLETLPSYVILLDRDYRVAFANKVFRETFGEDHGRRCYEYLFDKDQECEGCITYNVIRENKPQHWYWTGPNGHDYDIYDFPFIEADGSTLILEMGIDITELKKAEAQALESAKKLKDAERLAAIGATAGMVGHDIRNPLQAITGDVYFARKDLTNFSSSPEKERIEKSLSEIDKSVSYINKIVQDLQDFARPIQPTIQETDVEALCKELLQGVNKPSNISTLCQVEETLRKLPTDALILRRILTNLVNNAVQAMPDGGQVTLEGYRTGADAVITVTDTGYGIPDDVKPKLFTPLMTTKSKGQGFGLAVVKRMTEALGGTVSFESEVGKGAKFVIRLPIKE